MCTFDLNLEIKVTLNKFFHTGNIFIEIRLRGQSKQINTVILKIHSGFKHRMLGLKGKNVRSPTLCMLGWLRFPNIPPEFPHTGSSRANEIIDLFIKSSMIRIIGIIIFIQITNGNMYVPESGAQIVDNPYGLLDLTFRK